MEDMLPQRDHDGRVLSVRAVGIAEIDAQHAQLLLVLDRLEALAGTPNEFAAIVEGVDALFNYAQTHLAEEEHLLRQIGYPRFEAHAARHRRFVEAIMQLMSRLERGEDILADLISSIRTWLVEHINTDDMDYVPLIPCAQVR